MSDFTSGDNFANYLSSYWSQIFGDPEFIRGVADGFSRQLAQHYQDFAETVNAVSIRDIPPFHTELIYPIFLKESEFSMGTLPLTYGAGGVHGPQPSGGLFKEGKTMTFGGRADRAPVYYVSLPSDVVNTGSLILNRLHNPSVVLVAGADFAFENGLLVFRENIFDNDLVTKRSIAGENETMDREVVLWATNVQLEQFQLYRQYGHLFFSRASGGAEVRTALEAIFKLYSSGPSVARLDSFVAAAAGFPVSAEVSEEVLSIERLGDSQIVVTDVSAYLIPEGLTLRNAIKTGAILTAGSPLTTATEFNDRFSDPLWWTRLDGLTLHRGFMIAEVPFVGFLNQDTEVTLEDESVLVEGEERRLCRFYLAGPEKNVEAFWKAARERSLERGEFLAETLWKGAGLVDGDGEPDYTQSLIVNPMRLLNDLVGDNLLVLKVNETLAGGILPVLSLLRETIPAYCALVVLLNLESEDDYSMVSDSEDAVNPEELSFEDPSAHYNHSTGDFETDTEGYWEDTDPGTGEFLTKTAEALSSGFSSDILSDTIDLSDSSVFREGVTGRVGLNC